MRRMLFAAACLLVACNPQPPHGAALSSASPAASEAPAFTITGHSSKTQPVRISEQAGNRRLYQVVASSYTSHSAQNTANANVAEPTVTFYAKDGTKLVAQSPTAQVQSGKQVVLSGGVHAVTNNGLTLTCDTLTYDKQRDRLHGEGNVRITGIQGGQQQMLTGNTFTSDVKLTNMVIQ